MTFCVTSERSHLAMEIKERKYGLGIAATEAAFARDSEFRPIPRRSFNPRTRPRDTISEMNKP
jgi:hypothetical protein